MECFKKALMSLASACFVLLLTNSAFALETISIEGDSTSYAVGSHLEYFEDVEGSVIFENIQRDHIKQEWQPSTVKVPNFGFTSSTYWFVFELQDRRDLRKRQVSGGWILEIAYPLLDSVDVYFTRGPSNSLVEHYHLGDKLEFKERAIEHRNFLVPIQLPLREIMRVYIRLESTSSVQLPVKLWEERSFFEEDQFIILFNGLFYGLMLLIAIYNLFAFWGEREASYLYYVFYVITFAGFHTSLHGFGFQFLWSESVSFHDKSVAVFISTAMVFINLFADDFLELKTALPSQSRFLRGFAVVGLLLFLGCFWLPYAITIRVATFLVVPGVVGVLFSGMVLWRRGSSAARFFTQSWFILLGAAVLLVASKFGVIPRGFWEDLGMHIGAALQVVMLSFALAHRVNVFKQEKESAQEKALQVERQAAQDLAEEIKKTKQAKSELTLALSKAEEANKLKSEFLANVSHELRTPLNAIVNIPKALRDQYDKFSLLVCKNCGAEFEEKTSQASPKCPDCGESLLGEERIVCLGEPGEHLHFLARLHNSGQHLLNVVNDLLNVSKLEAQRVVLNWGPISLGQLLVEVEDTIFSLAKDKGIQLRFENLPKSLNLVADAIRLKQILINLLGNSIKFTDSGGWVSLRVIPKTIRNAEWLEFCVEDNGMGIPLSSQESIFESFRQVDGTHTRLHQGTGLGLAITRHLVELHHGRIWVESAPEKGSRFFFELPVNGEEIDNA